MNGNLRALIACGLVLTVYSSAIGVVRADGPASSGSSESAEVVGLGLDYWIGCSYGSDPDKLGPRLCEKSNAAIDDTAYRLLDNALGTGLGSTEAICAADAIVVRSLSQCSLSARYETVDMIADLALGLADNWRMQGEPNRSEQLFRWVSNLLEGFDQHTLTRMNVLESWAAFEMERGELHHAMELADLHLALARKWYDELPGSSSNVVKALELKARILEKLDLDNEANATLEEAENLAGVPDSCPEQGLCVCTKGMDGDVICNEEHVPFFDCTLVADGHTACKRRR